MEASPTPAVVDVSDADFDRLVIERSVTVVDRCIDSRRGAVIGVCVASRGAPTWFSTGKPVQTDEGPILYDSGISSVVPAMYVAELLERTDVPWTSA